jgi:regulator of replication initiation timing
MPKHEPISDKEVTALRAEYQHLLEENDALRIENVQLRRQLRSKDETIDHLELKDHARTKRMGDLHEQIYQLGVAKQDLETENRNLKFTAHPSLARITVCIALNSLMSQSAPAAAPPPPHAETPPSCATS